MCDGRDDDGDGLIDNGLVRKCVYPLGTVFLCGQCPLTIPTFDVPSPALICINKPS